MTEYRLNAHNKRNQFEGIPSNQFRGSKYIEVATDMYNWTCVQWYLFPRCFFSMFFFSFRHWIIFYSKQTAHRHEKISEYTIEINEKKFRYFFASSHNKCDYLLFKVQDNSMLCWIPHDERKATGFRIISFSSDGFVFLWRVHNTLKWAHHINDIGNVVRSQSFAFTSCARGYSLCRKLIKATKKKIESKQNINFNE